MTLPFLEKYITHDAVLKKLIHYRCKVAEQAQRTMVVSNLAAKGDNDEEDNKRKKKNQEPSKLTKELLALFPPRRKWVHMGHEKKRQTLTQIEKNERNLLLTVKREARKEGQHAEWYERLEERISRIVNAALTSTELFRKPKVTVIEKKQDAKTKTIECRPICLFKTLDERIWASLYNQVFTHLLDDLFYENSMAFRVRRKDDPEMLHLKAVRKITDFRRAHAGQELWVAECDMKKFYDTLDHDVVKKRFSQMLLWKKQDGTINNEEWRRLRKILYGYVDCYNFYQDVYKYNARPKLLCLQLKSYHRALEVRSEKVSL